VSQSEITLIQRSGDLVSIKDALMINPRGKAISPTTEPRAEPMTPTDSEFRGVLRVFTRGALLVFVDGDPGSRFSGGRGPNGFLGLNGKA
jgi:hypothetical protein